MILIEAFGMPAKPFPITGARIVRPLDKVLPHQLRGSWAGGGHSTPQQMDEKQKVICAFITAHPGCASYDMVRNQTIRRVCRLDAIATTTGQQKSLSCTLNALVNGGYIRREKRTKARSSASIYFAI